MGLWKIDQSLKKEETVKYDRIWPGWVGSYERLCKSINTISNAWLGQLGRKLAEKSFVMMEASTSRQVKRRGRHHK
jgi:hypothetical protein